MEENDNHTCNTTDMPGSHLNADTITYRTYLEFYNTKINSTVLFQE